VSEPLLNLLVERVSGPVPLVAQLLQEASLTPADLQEIKRLITPNPRFTPWAIVWAPLPRLRR